MHRTGVVGMQFVRICLVFFGCSDIRISVIFGLRDFISKSRFRFSNFGLRAKVWGGGVSLDFGQETYSHGFVVTQPLCKMHPVDVAKEISDELGMYGTHFSNS